MTRDEFKKLQPGDRFRHPLFTEPFTVKNVEAYNGENHSITTTDGRRMKINDIHVTLSIKIEEVP